MSLIYRFHTVCNWLALVDRTNVWVLRTGSNVGPIEKDHDKLGNLPHAFRCFLPLRSGAHFEPKHEGTAIVSCKQLVFPYF